MSKTITFRLDDDAAALLDEKVLAAGMSRTDYLVGLLAGSAPSGADSERVSAMLARSIDQDGIIAGLREEIKELKRKVRTDRQVDSVSTVSVGKMGNAAVKGPPREIPPHSAHSGLHPKPGCEVCAELAKHPIKEASGKGCPHPMAQRRGNMCLACSAPWSV